MIDAFCERLTCLIKTNVPDIDDEKAEIINFGIQSMVSEISKTCIILTAAYFLGILKLIIIAMISFGTYRTFAGGFHARTHLICLFTTSSMFFGIVYLSIFIAPYSEKLDILYILIFIFNSLIIYRYAPADVEEKPILSKKLREKLRIQASFAMSLILILSVTVIKDETISNILIFATFVESITLLPISYKLMRCRHGYEETAK